MKLKMLGLALLALVATSAFAATNASGAVAGHFIHHGTTNNAVITAHDGIGTAHTWALIRLNPGTHETSGASSLLQCKTSQYTGRVEAKTVASVQLFPKYTECATPDGTPMTVDPNGCSYTFLSQGARKHGTAIVDCPAGQAIELTHPGCTTKIPAQTTASTLTEGLSYTNQADGTITADVTVNTITVHSESGGCILLGTSSKYELKGTVTVQGFEYVSGQASSHTLVHGAAVKITST